MKSIVSSIRSKGVTKYVKRGRSILSSYSPTPSKMMAAIEQFSRVLSDFQCSATFPITAVAVERHGGVLNKYIAQGIEFAIHGYRHIDHSQATFEDQLAQLDRAKQVFADADVPVSGVRCPYLRFNEHLPVAVKKLGLTYTSNQPFLWDILGSESLSSSSQSAYQRAIAFYQPWIASERLSLPYLQDGLVEIPVSLPDDEILVDRLGGNGNGLIERAWISILTETYERGELFTLQLHPERIARCAYALRAVLAESQKLEPRVWIARLDEIADWWRSRTIATVTTVDEGEGTLLLKVDGPKGSSLLMRHMKVDGPATPWRDGFLRCDEKHIRVKTPIRPFVGATTDASPKLVQALRDEGYIVEVNDDGNEYAFHIDGRIKSADTMDSLRRRIEEGGRPLIKFARWPEGARSALSITGDIDALTIWDFGLRFLGR